MSKIGCQENLKELHRRWTNCIAIALWMQLERIVQIAFCEGDSVSLGPISLTNLMLGWKKVWALLLVLSFYHSMA